MIAMIKNVTVQLNIIRPFFFLTLFNFDYSFSEIRAIRFVRYKLLVANV